MKPRTCKITKVYAARVRQYSPYSGNSPLASPLNLKIQDYLEGDDACCGTSVQDEVDIAGMVGARSHQGKAGFDHGAAISVICLCSLLVTGLVTLYTVLNCL